MSGLQRKMLGLVASFQSTHGPLDPEMASSMVLAYFQQICLFSEEACVHFGLRSTQCGCQILAELQARKESLRRPKAKTTLTGSFGYGTIALDKLNLWRIATSHPSGRLLNTTCGFACACAWVCVWCMCVCVGSLTYPKLLWSWGWPWISDSPAWFTKCWGLRASRVLPKHANELELAQPVVIVFFFSKKTYSNDSFCDEQIFNPLQNK